MADATATEKLATAGVPTEDDGERRRPQDSDR